MNRCKTHHLTLLIGKKLTKLVNDFILKLSRPEFDSRHLHTRPCCNGSILDCDSEGVDSISIGLTNYRGYSSVGRAIGLQPIGRGFNSLQLHKVKIYNGQGLGQVNNPVG